MIPFISPQVFFHGEKTNRLYQDGIFYNNAEHHCAVSTKSITSDTAKPKNHRKMRC